MADNQDPQSGSSARGESAWKEAREAVAERNQRAQKAGRDERDAYDRQAQRRPARSRALRTGASARPLRTTRGRLRGDCGAERVGRPGTWACRPRSSVERGDLEAGAGEQIGRERVRWQPPKSASATARADAASAAPASSGASPCSTNCRAAPGFSTRRSSASAAPTSGIVHSVQVEIAESKLSSSKGSDWPSRPERSTGTGEARTRSAASFQPTPAGSTAATRVTPAG